MSCRIQYYVSPIGCQCEKSKNKSCPPILWTILSVHMDLLYHPTTTYGRLFDVSVVRYRMNRREMWCSLVNLRGYSKGLGKKERAKQANNLCALVFVCSFEKGEFRCSSAAKKNYLCWAAVCICEASHRVETTTSALAPYNANHLCILICSSCDIDDCWDLLSSVCGSFSPFVLILFHICCMCSHQFSIFCAQDTVCYIYL